jgi:hypothetical protein
MDNFEEILNQMSKPEITSLKHADLLAKAIANNKDKSVVSLWWLLIPLYIIAALVMKGIYMPQSTLRDNLHQLSDKQGYLSLVVFIILPVLLIIINVLTIKRIHFLSGSPKAVEFLKIVRFNIVFILISLLLFIFYFL